jgi:GTPase
MSRSDAPTLMADPQQDWAVNILAGDRRAIARAISAVEGGDPAGRNLLKRLFPKTGNAFTLGITGPPGAGKSTLVEKLAGEYRTSGKQVGILAVDPTSPFSGGAILGDRIRMQNLAIDAGVYIRSMATRGQMGGLAPAAHDVVTILDAAGCETVLIETVGVGQDEVEVARLADVTVLVLVPGMGDDVQTFKAGVMEIADIFVVNKADRPGADRVEQEILAMLSIGTSAPDWQPPVLKTVATTGDGVPELRRKLDEYRAFYEKGSARSIRQHEQWRLRILALLRQRLFEKFLTERVEDGAIDARLNDVVARRVDPYSVVDQLIEEAGLSPGQGNKGDL